MKTEHATDRELLKLAAKAAGFKEVSFDGRPVGYYAHGKIGSWNPLKDDGDALRLAVALEISIEPSGNSTCAISKGHEVVVIGTVRIDLSAATRRAIVRVAAEIGRTMR